MRLEIVGRAPVGRREGDAPEIGRGGIEFQGDVIALGHFASGSRDAACNGFPGGRVLEDQVRVDGNSLLEADESAVIVYAERGGFKRDSLALKRDMNIGSHT